MKEKKWTPGPWEFLSPTRENPSRVFVSAMNRQVDIYNAPLTSDTEANAHLIAAAPDMYDALKMLMDVGGDNVYDAKKWREAKVMGAQALKEARGEA